jgi:hypothetical protein
MEMDIDFVIRSIKEVMKKKELKENEEEKKL